MEHENRLDRLGSKDVEVSPRPRPEVSAGLELDPLGRDAGGLPLVHLEAGLGERPTDLEVAPRPVRTRGTSLGGVRPEGEDPPEEAHQMVHLVVQAVSIPVRHVRQLGRGRRLKESGNHAVHGAVVGVSVALLLQPSLDPHFEEVLVKRVTQSAQRHLSRGEPGVRGAHVDGVEPPGWALGDQQVQHAVHRLGELWVPRHLRKVPKVQLERSKLGEHGGVSGPGCVVAPPAAGCSAADLHRPVRDARRRVEGAH
mmetsp:Transcript_64637/g.145808  ORF Transcript_64637/g.145808 Transcript_64637/m.145808 type:complete len:254 (-) Transcript_64637:502-1263(-)